MDKGMDSRGRGGFGIDGCREWVKAYFTESKGIYAERA